MAHAYLTAINPPEVIQRCTKVAFPSRRDAFKAVRTHNRANHGTVEHGKGVMTAYRCGICKNWHLGHRN